MQTLASQKFTNGSVEWFMFTTFWKLCQQFWIVENSDDYWQSLIDECNKFYNTFKDVGLSQQLTMALIEYLESKNK